MVLFSLTTVFVRHKKYQGKIEPPGIYPPRDRQFGDSAIDNRVNPEEVVPKIIADI